MQQKQFKGEIYSNIVPPQETRTSQKNNLTLHLKKLEKEEQKTPKLAEGKKT